MAGDFGTLNKTPGINNGSSEVKSNSRDIQAKLYLDHFRKYEVVTSIGLKTITDAHYNTTDIDDARNFGRENKFYPVLEKLILGEGISSDEDSILNVAQRYGGLDNAYYLSVLRYDAERKMVAVAQDLGFGINDINRLAEEELDARNIIFSNRVGLEVLSSIDYSRTLILPERVKDLVDYNQDYYSLQSFIKNMDEKSSAENLLKFSNALKGIGLIDLTEKLENSSLYSRDTKAREFIKSLERMRVSDIGNYVKIVGEEPKKTSEDLEHAYVRGLYSNPQLYRFFLSRHGDSK